MEKNHQTLLLQTARQPHDHPRRFALQGRAANSIKTWEKDYAKYIKEADDKRDFVESQIQKSATLVKPADDVSNSPTPPEKKKPPRNRRLKSGAGEEGRTPDLMLGKHTL